MAGEWKLRVRTNEGSLGCPFPGASPSAAQFGAAHLHDARHRNPEIRAGLHAQAALLLPAVNPTQTRVMKLSTRSRWRTALCATPRCLAFTLIELLVVIAIIAVL